MRPKISIITVCLNAESTIEETLLSIISQTYNNYELIVIDGGSTDRTLSIIKKFESYISFLVSEKDQGIYEAMNKGINQAVGKYLLFLNADDSFLECTSLENAIELMVGSENTIYACSILYGGNRNWRIRVPSGFNKTIYWKHVLYHQATLIPRTMFDQLGNYNTCHSIVSDYEWFFRAYISGVKVKILPIVLSRVSDMGISGRGDWQGLSTRLRELRAVHYQYRNSKIIALAYRMYWKVYYPYRYIKSSLLREN